MDIQHLEPLKTIIDLTTDKKLLGLTLLPVLFTASILGLTSKLTIPSERTWIFFVP